MKRTGPSWSAGRTRKERPSPAAGAGPGPGPLFWRVAAVVVALSALSATLWKFHPEIARLEELNARASALLEEERRLEETLAEVERKHRWLRDDPAVAEALARDRLDLRRPGETIYRIIPSDEVP